MWNKDKSVTLSLVCTKIAIVLVFATAIAAPFAPLKTFFREGGFIEWTNEYIPLIIAVILVCCIAALVALFSLNRLLTNIRGGDVFTAKNVRLLRIISWMCFACAAALFVGCIAIVALFVIGALACFFGLILRVVKNVIEAAVQLKDENDFTI